MGPSAQAKSALTAAVSAAELSRGLSSMSPAEQMAIVEAAQRAARESDGGMMIARNHSCDEATVGSWVSSMEAVWGGLAALEARTEQRKTNNNTSSGGSGNPADAALGGADVAAGPMGGAGAADERKADVGATSSDVQQVQDVSPTDAQLLQPAIVTEAS